MSQGRGRGARGGRGGLTRTFNREQLTAMGIINEAAPTLVTQPPPLFPLLEHRPLPIRKTAELDYLVTLRQDFVDHMQLSSSYIRTPVEAKEQHKKEIDKILDQLQSGNAKDEYDWGMFPAELRPKSLAKKVVVKRTNAEVNVEDKLNALEKQEESKKMKIKEETVEEEEEEVEEQQEEDHEMDDGTDYANNYFDNGENEDEDEYMSEGPIF
ncbi:unnamed protein product [Ceutorhynchus assimilis]|uniref:DNA-directed RNA polymerase III subunit n=1 Tax=Ceutorhynchus assimilis TaxID=467358 RepID=A0A9P0GRI8_9CUCU|nr:unnamed protein product [Ceutorhynchus assimilis]